MVTFTDRVLVSLAEPANVPGFISGMSLNSFLLRDFRRRFNTEFWNVAGVTTGAVRVLGFEDVLSIEKRLMGREEHHNGSGSNKTLIDYRYYGEEQTLWTDVVLEVETTWDVDQFPGTVSVSDSTPAAYEGLADLVSVLRFDAAGHPLDVTGVPVANVTLDAAGHLRTNDLIPVDLVLDPLAGALRQPDGSLHTRVLLELFPKVGPTTPLLGAPLGEDGQPVPDLLMDHHGQFTDFAGTPSALDPVTNLPLDSAGQPVHLAVVTTPEQNKVDYGFFFSLPVVNNRLTLQLMTRLHLLLPLDVDLVRDLRRVVLLRRHLETRTDYLLNLDNTQQRIAHVFGLVYEANSLNATGLTAAAVQHLGDQLGTLIHFFPEP